MDERHTGRQFRGYLQMNGISLEDAAGLMGVSTDYLNNTLARSDLPDGLRRRICEQFPDTRPFMIPEWARIEVA